MRGLSGVRVLPSYRMRGPRPPRAALRRPERPLTGPGSYLPGMALQATLTTSGLELVLHVTGYEFPEVDTGWDANWLLCEIELDLQHHLGSVSASRSCPSSSRPSPTSSAPSSPT
jgi:hypothetical protein